MGPVTTVSLGGPFPLLSGCSVPDEEARPKEVKENTVSVLSQINIDPVPPHTKNCSPNDLLEEPAVRPGF